tara:strand:+ start:68 stop:769 length:702 start_codon:yes stop_codon:yes gene_type:complete
MTLNIIRNRVGNDKITKGKNFVKQTFYKHGKREYITTNSATGRANRITTAQKRLCCSTKPNEIIKDNEIHMLSQTPVTKKCCPTRQIIRSGVNSNVTLNSRGTYEQNNNKTYYQNASQRLRARNMSFEKNMPTQKNSILKNSCCRNENGKFKQSYSKSSSCCAPIDKTQYGLHSSKSNNRRISNVPSKSDSGARTFALRHANNTVFDKRKTEEEKKPDKHNNICINKKRCYKR